MYIIFFYFYSSVLNPETDVFALLFFRASSLLSILRDEEYYKLRAGRAWEHIQAGDTVEVERVPYLTAPKNEIVKGLVLRKVNKASDTFISILNVSYRFAAFAPPSSPYKLHCCCLAKPFDDLFRRLSLALCQCATW